MAEFALAFLVVAIALYAPGYLIGRALNFAPAAALAAAPASSIPLIVAIGIALAAAGVACPALTLLAAELVIALVVYAACRSARRKGVAANGDTDVLPLSGKSVWHEQALYVAVALVVCATMFLTAIDGPDSFARKYDTTAHLSLVRAFLDSGTYSILNCGPFLAEGTEGAFYPAAWHIVAAIAASAVGDSVDTATNALTLATCCAVLPLGMHLLLSTAAPEKQGVVLAGSLFTLAFAIFPWGFLTRGQLFPNLLSYALVPAVLALFVGAIEAKGAQNRAKIAAGTAIGLVAVAMGHPNGAFVCGIGMACYGLCRIFRSPQAQRATVTPRTVGLGLGLIVGACLLWMALFFAPPLRNVVTYGDWQATLSLPEAVFSALSFMYAKWGGIQPGLSVLVLLGVIATLRERRYLWFSIAYALTLAIYVANVSAEGFLLQLLSGFWYSDLYRTAAMNALFAIPLAAFGFAWLAQLAASALKRIPQLGQHGRARRILTAGALATLLATSLFANPIVVKMGDLTIQAGLPAMRQQVEDLYSWDSVYTAEERAFVKQAMQMMEDGTLAANKPADGTAWCYGTDGMPTLFRRTNNSNGGNSFPSQDNAAIRMGLADVASDDGVRRALENTGTRYVIMLDDPSGNDPTLDTTRYDPDSWKGFDAVTPETPGFELLLSEGDMRFYRITALD